MLSSCCFVFQYTTTHTPVFYYFFFSSGDRRHKASTRWIHLKVFTGDQMHALSSWKVLLDNEIFIKSQLQNYTDYWYQHKNKIGVLTPPPIYLAPAVPSHASPEWAVWRLFFSLFLLRMPSFKNTKLGDTWFITKTTLHVAKWHGCNLEPFLSGEYQMIFIPTGYLICK